ncbi:MAG: hypothetical protein U1E65_21575 [Myxococcota bacterium]
MSIHLKKNDIDQGVARAMKTIVNSLGSKDSAVLTGAEVGKYSGKGRSMLRKTYLYAQHLEDGFQVKKNAVKRSTMQRAFRQLGSGLKSIADKQGNRDGVLDGPELRGRAHNASSAGQAFARWISATKS